MSKFKRALLLQVAGMLLVAGVIVILTRYFGLIQIVIHLQKKLGHMEIWGGVIYVPLRAACNILLLPGSVLTVTSGLCFGLWWGFFLSLMGNVLGAAVTFGISRMLGRVEDREALHRIRHTEKESRVGDGLGAHAGLGRLLLPQARGLLEGLRITELAGLPEEREGLLKHFRLRLMLDQPWDQDAAVGAQFLQRGCEVSKRALKCLPVGVIIRVVGQPFFEALHLSRRLGEGEGAN